MTIYSEQKDEKQACSTTKTCGSGIAEQQVEIKEKTDACCQETASAKKAEEKVVELKKAGGCGC